MQINLLKTSEYSYRLLDTDSFHPSMRRACLLFLHVVLASTPLLKTTILTHSFSLFKRLLILKLGLKNKLDYFSYIVYICESKC